MLKLSFKFTFCSFLWPYVIWLKLWQGHLPKEYLHGLATTSWPGRGQVIHCNALNKEITDGDHEIGRLDFYLDGAHTVESLEACADWFYAATTKGKLMDDNNVGMLSDGHVNGPTRTNIREVVQLQKVKLLSLCLCETM